MSSEKLLCPSHRCETGSILLGIVMRDGRVAFSSERIVVSEEFVQIASQGRTPEKRFRFGGNCVQAGCKQWTDGQCGVIEKVVADVDTSNEPAGLPECSIRPECRWFDQRGPAACAACPLVITDMREDVIA